MHDQSSTHFGYESIPTDQKNHRVGEVFHSVAERYDVMNDLMSLGIHRLWKKIAVELCGVRPGHQVLDLAGGTGDLAFKFAQRVSEHSKPGMVTVADINASMLQVGRDRAIDRGLMHAPLQYVQANAECLPFPSNSFDRITIAFGLRNVTTQANALSEMQRVLKPGGRAIILEFSKPQGALLNRLYDTYSFGVLPKLGEWVARDADSYRYLAESIRMHPDQTTLADMMKTAGFDEVTYSNLTGGIVAIHRGDKW